jgi:hypothetical protein
MLLKQTQFRMSVSTIIFCGFIHHEENTILSLQKASYQRKTTILQIPLFTQKNIQKYYMYLICQVTSKNYRREHKRSNA